jgi:predicted GNAT family acetyltransferase
MNIEIEEAESKGRAYVVGDAKAKMTYSRAGNKLLIIDHTEVDDSFRGQGVGKRLLHKLVDYARSNQLKIMPLCPYAKSVFEKEEGIRDVLRQ